MSRRQIIFIHIVFWTLDCIAYGNSAYGDFESISFLYSFIPQRILDVSVFYLCYFSISSKRYSIKKNILYIFSILLFICFYSYPYGYVVSYIDSHFIDTSLVFDEIIMLNYRTGIVNLFTMAVFGTFLKFTILWYNITIRQKEIEKQSIVNELALLKAQINPDFFFDTLNSIESFIGIDLNKTLQLIDKLSDTMSYILYESSVEKIDIKKEIDFIKGYIELQKIKYNYPDNIKLTINDNFPNIMIPPLLFIPYIENSFKHKNNLSSFSEINIYLNILKDRIDFSVSNYFKNSDKSKRESIEIEFKNIRRRLDLLFNKNYNLEVTQNDNHYVIKLNLSLKDI
jgi:sensor histidine kinase YesM